MSVRATIDSNIPWVGGIPADWNVAPLSAVVLERNQKNLGMVENNLLSLSYGRVIQKDIASADGLLPASFETYQIVEPNDIVWRLTDLQNDKRSLRTAKSGQRGIITSAYLVTIPKGVDAGYLSYLTRSYDLTKVFYSMGGGLRQTMKYDDVKRLPVVIPPRTEQIAIAAFLDHETGKIDGLIAEQERLITLLGEKRQAVISHGVTNDSENARLTPAKLAAKFINGHAFKPEDWGDAGIPIVRIAQLQGAMFDNSFNGDCPPRCHINDGDLLFSWSATLDSFIWNRGAAYLNQHIFKVSPYEGVDLRFLYYSLKHHAPLWGDIDAHGSTMKHIKRESLSNGIWLPSLEEQQQIANKLDHQMEAIDGLKGAADGTIKLLKERSSALISAAVTGKIDVRNHPAAAAALNENKD